MSTTKSVLVTCISGTLVGFGLGVIAITRPQLPPLSDVQLLSILFVFLVICLILLIISIVKTLKPVKKEDSFYLPRLKIG